MAVVHSQTVKLLLMFVICGCCPLTDSEASAEGSLYVAAVLSQTLKLVKIVRYLKLLSINRQ